MLYEVITDNGHPEEAEFLPEAHDDQSGEREDHAGRQRFTGGCRGLNDVVLENVILAEKPQRNNFV